MTFRVCMEPLPQSLLFITAQGNTLLNPEANQYPNVYKKYWDTRSGKYRALVSIMTINSVFTSLPN